MSSNTVIMGAGMTNMEISMIQMASQQMIPIKSGRKNPEVHQVKIGMIKGMIKLGMISLMNMKGISLLFINLKEIN